MSLADLIGAVWSVAAEIDAACPCADARAFPTPCQGICLCVIGKQQGSRCAWPGHFLRARFKEALLEIVEAWGFSCGSTHDLDERCPGHLKERAAARERPKP